jgi:hypothetical protein
MFSGRDTRSICSAAGPLGAPEQDAAQERVQVATAPHPRRHERRFGDELAAEPSAASISRAPRRATVRTS